MKITVNVMKMKKIQSYVDCFKYITLRCSRGGPFITWSQTPFDFGWVADKLFLESMDQCIIVSIGFVFYNNLIMVLELSSIRVSMDG